MIFFNVLFGGLALFWGLFGCLVIALVNLCFNLAIGYEYAMICPAFLLLIIVMMDLCALLDRMGM